MKVGASASWDRLASMLHKRVGNATGEAFTSALESCLVPIVRLALERKIGPEPVLQWVQEKIQTLAPNQDMRSMTRPLARALGEQIRDRFDPFHRRETVVGF